MNWTEILIKVDTEYTEQAEAIANMSVPYGIYIEDYSDLIEQSWEIAHVDLIEEDLLEKDRTSSLIHIFLDEKENAVETVEYLKELLTASKIPFAIENKLVDDANWKDEWKKHFKCTEIGGGLVIKPSWEKYNNKTHRYVLHLDPGAAFGTGTHPTTRMCLELMEDYLPFEAEVLDIGCGSGILSIAAALYGCGRIVGVDIDEQAVKVARENARLNKVGDKIEYTVGDITEKVTGKFDLIFANIVSDVIIKLLAGVREYMKENTVILASGVIDIRYDDVVNAFKEHGFKIEKTVKTDNWYAFAVKGE